MRKSLTRAVGGNRYPGRGIVIGKTRDGKRAVYCYFIMGRSASSRSRIFVEDGDSVQTQAIDKGVMDDPSLLLYYPVKRVNGDIIVTNGDQTDDIERYLLQGVCFRRALMQRTFEPDAPNFTPRISGVLHLGKGAKDYSYELSILKCEDGKGKACSRAFYLYEAESGTGHLLHTYKKDGNPLPPFEGEPVRVKLGNDIHAIAEELWNALDEDNKISLIVRTVDLKTGNTESVLFNKYEGGKA